MSAYSESPLHSSNSPVPLHQHTRHLSPLLRIQIILYRSALPCILSSSSTLDSSNPQLIDTTVSLTPSCMDTGYCCCSFCVLLSVYVQVSISECVYVQVCIRKCVCTCQRSFSSTIPQELFIILWRQGLLQDSLIWRSRLASELQESTSPCLPQAGIKVRTAMPGL